uniref:SH3 domain-containing protein n=1 Tax=Steinernema glaseri TaxID=37863 RepID=A0A1I7YNV4_9BILA
MSIFHSLFKRKTSRLPPVPVSKEGTEAKISIAFHASSVEEITVPAGIYVSALYRDENWIYVQRRDGQKGFIPDQCCHLYVNGVHTVPGS